MCVFFQFLSVLHVLINLMSKQVTRCTCYLLGLPSQNATNSVPNKTEMNFLQFWRPEVQGQGVGGFDFSGSLSH